MWFPVSLLEALAHQCCWQGCFCENFLFCFCQGYSVLLEPFKWQLSSNCPCFGYSEFGSLLHRYMMRGRWGPSLSSLPYLYTHQQFSSSLFPCFSVFSVILLLQASTLIWILLLHALVFHVPLFSVSFALSLISLLLDSSLYSLLLNQLTCMANVGGVRLPVSVGLGSS